MKNNFVIETKNLVKKFGETEALKGVSVTVRKGSITGLVGRNGAGKTTLLRMVMQLLLPNSGEVFLFGEKSEGDRFDLRRRIGYVPEQFSLYPNMSGEQAVKFNASLKGVKPDEKKVKKLADMFSLDLKKKAGALSKGGKQALAFIVAVSTSPELLVLDEPMSGMDPIAREAFVKSVVEECSNGVTVFYSSHILPEVESFADTICVINSGRCVLEEPLDDLKLRFRRISFLPAKNFSEDALKALNGVKRFEHSGNGVIVYTDEFSEKLLSDISKFADGEPEVQILSLSEIFKEVVK